MMSSCFAFYLKDEVNAVAVVFTFVLPGLLLPGADKLVNYVEVMQDVRYVNARPDELNSRTFVLTCTELNGRFVSNELQVTVGT